MVRLKTPEDIKIMKEGGKISRSILDSALRHCKPGVSPMEINNEIGKMLEENGVDSWFLDVDNYPYVSCIAVNDVWVHGIPSREPLVPYDVVSIDLGIKYKGYYLDNCWTTVVQQSDDCPNVRKCFEHPDKSVQKFLQVSSEALYGAIKTFRKGCRVGDISYEMQKIVENNGFSMIREYAGHGVGFSFHEDPCIPCVGDKGDGELLEVGTVIAIEIMASMGKSDVVIADDGWSAASKDGSITSMFEHTVALTEKGAVILTK